MAAAPQTISLPQVLTYEDYLAEGEINRRYEIIDGVRTYMAGPSEQRQDIAFDTGTLLKEYERARGQGKMILAPRDILITRSPFRTRQPEVMFISHARHAQNPPREDASPMTVAPELVIEVLSPSDTPQTLESKLRDYCRVHVEECWLLHPDRRTVEVLRLSTEGYESIAVYSCGQSVQSLTFSDLQVPVDAIFAL